MNFFFSAYIWSYAVQDSHERAHFLSQKGWAKEGSEGKERGTIAMSHA